MLSNELQDWQYLVSKGQAFFQQRDFNNAEQYLRQAVLVAQTQRLHPEHLAVAISNLAMVKEEQGIYPDAKTLYEQSLEILRNVYPNGDDSIVRILNKLERVNQALGIVVKTRNFQPSRPESFTPAPINYKNNAPGGKANPVNRL
jgi:tetratricopeptide (TPR) repeat protein